MTPVPTRGDAILVRSWNLYHGRSHPPDGVDYLEAAIRLASVDRPHVLCLQEVPPWALERLPDWTGMLAFGDVTRRPSLGLLPLSPRHGRWLTSLKPRLFRSAFTGQANAIVVRPELAPRNHRSLCLNPRDFRRRFGGQYSRRDHMAWRRERRCCQTLEITLPDGRPALVANLHATNHLPNGELAELELQHALRLLEGLVPAGEAIILAGDFNREPSRSQAFEALDRLGFSAPGAAIDHVLVRGADASRLSAWDSERRRRHGVLLSDHAPVELEIITASS
jgi:Endonuclease/Exonuclease/phosphatase family